MALSRSFKKLRDMGVGTYGKLFHNCVTPVIDYGAGVWGLTKNPKAENVQRRAIRFFLGVHKFAPNLAIEGDMGWDPCKVRWNVEMVRLWNRLVSMDNTRLAKRVFDWDYQLQTNNWSSDLHMIFGNTQLLTCYDNKSQCDLEIMRSKLMELECNTWANSLDAKPKLRTYRTFKEDYKQEHYLTMNLSRTERSCLAQFRSGVLPIRVETGRFKREAIEERVCIFCDKGEIEDECHLVMSCDKYGNLREQMFDYIANFEVDFDNLDVRDQFNVIVKKYPRQLAKFIKNSMNIRRKTEHINV